MPRETVARLYSELMTTEMDFMVRGTIHIHEIYDSVKAIYPHLCNDDYLCRDNCPGSKARRPEWEHKIRWALKVLKSTTNKVTNVDTPREFWRFY